MEQVKEFSKAGRFANDIVDKNLMKFEKNLTINQQKVLYYLIIQEKNGQSLQGVSWNKLQELVGIKAGQHYSVARKQKFIKEMTDVKLWVYVDDKNMGSHVIFPSFELINDNLQYSINQRFPDLFNNPTVGYFIMNQELIREFKHDHSIRIYQLLNRQLGANDKSVNDFTFRYDQLKEYLNLENTKYKGSDFKKRILDPSLNEINEFTDISIKGKYNSRTKKWQLSSKFGNPEEFFIGGISRKNTVQEYVQEQFDSAVIAKKKGRTKINKTTKVDEFKESEHVNLPNEQSEIKNCGVFGHVKLSFEQFQKAHKLFANLEELERAITLLDEYLEQNPDKHYANHYVSLKQFSKKIIDAQNSKAEQKGNYNYNNSSKDVYVEPKYDNFDEDDASKLSLEEIQALLDDPFGTIIDDEKESTEVKEIITANCPEKEQSISPTIIKKMQGGMEIRNEELHQYLEDTAPNSMSNINMMEEPLLSMVEKLYIEIERLYFSFHDGQIDTEIAKKELEEKETRYEHKLTSEEKYELNRVAREKWEAIPF